LTPYLQYASVPLINSEGDERMERAGYEFRSDRHGEVWVERMPERWRMVRLNRLFTNIHRELERREGVCGPSSAKWCRAWERNPDLRAQNKALMDQWMPEREYDKRLAEKALKVEKRRRKAEFARQSREEWEARKCPTCGQHTLQAAA